MAALPRFAVFAFICFATICVELRRPFPLIFLRGPLRGIETASQPLCRFRKKKPRRKRGFKETEEHCGLLVLILLARLLLAAALLSALSGLLSLLAWVLLLATLLAALVLLTYIVSFL